MNTIRIVKIFGIITMSLLFFSCSAPSLVQKTESDFTPTSYKESTDTLNTAKLGWQDFFKDSNLVALIDTALKNNQEYNILAQEINIASSEAKARKGEYLPFVDFMAGAGVEKVGRYTSQGANDENTEIRPGEEFPDPLGDFMFSANASWEIDVWKKLRNSKKSAVLRYLASVEGRNFMATQLVAEIASSYYELLALDNHLEILKANIKIQQNALKIVRQEKQAAMVTELAVRKFEAEVLKNQSEQFYIQQLIVEAENKINFLIGRFPQKVKRDSKVFNELIPSALSEGIPSQLLENRPDIRQAEMHLEAAKLDVKAAKANFYPSLRITAGVGYQAFNPKYLLTTPESMLYSVAGDVVAPLINRNAIKANYNASTAKQIQAVYNYEQTVLRAYIEVVNQLSKIDNLEKSYDLKVRQVEALTTSIDISTGLFRSARADYMEVLLTQRDALESKIELIETKTQQLTAVVDTYRALGGGWK